MNCEQVFEVLTRAPFPTGIESTDIPAQRHLSACDDCRELAQAFRPALDLLHEAMASTESAGLPGYWETDSQMRLPEWKADIPASEPVGRASTESHWRIASEERRLQRLSPRRPGPYLPKPPGWSIPAGLRGACFAAAMLLGALLCLGAWHAIQSYQAALSPLALQEGRARAAEQSILPASPRQVPLELENLGLAAGCLQAFLRGKRELSTSNTQPAKPAKHTAELCCTQCHYADRDHAGHPAGAADAPKAPTAVLAKSCAICHL